MNRYLEMILWRWAQSSMAAVQPIPAIVTIDLWVGVGNAIDYRTDSEWAHLTKQLLETETNLNYHHDNGRQTT